MARSLLETLEIERANRQSRRQTATLEVPVVKEQKRVVYEPVVDNMYNPTNPYFAASKRHPYEPDEIVPMDLNEEAPAKPKFNWMYWLIFILLVLAIISMCVVAISKI